LLGLPANFCAALERLVRLLRGNGRRRAVLAPGALECAAHEGIADEGR